MSFEEKSTWSYFVAVALAYAGHLAIVLVRMRGVPVTAVHYAGPMFASIGAAIGLSVLGNAVAALATPKEAGQRDERDMAIARYGDVVGYIVLSVGILGALGLTVAEVAHFWIGNAIYLACVLAALASTGVKLVAYRRGFTPW